MVNKGSPKHFGNAAVDFCSAVNALADQEFQSDDSRDYHLQRPRSVSSQFPHVTEKRLSRL